MKKLLALVLALVMTLGLATVSTSAAYSDQADINYDEAVDVMTAIGIFEGKSGAFDPKANLNRAEAAKVVAYLMLGNSTAENLKGIGTKFTDVPASHWAAGYIEYLASVGIVSGVGDNKFDPNGQVTGIQLAKMLLVALGYDAKIEGFVGPDWAINIQSIANKVGIYDGNDSIVGTAPVSRDEAALYAFNTIKSPLVEYDNTTTVNVSGATVTVGGNKAKYVINNSTAKQTIDNAMEVNTNNYLVEFAEQYYKDLKLVLNDKVDDFGRPANTWTYKNEEIGTYVDFTEQVGAAYTAKVTQKMLYELLGKGVYDSLVAGRTTLTVYQDGVVTSVSRNDIDDYVNSENTGAVNGTSNGSETQVFMDDDDNVIVVTRHPYVFQASTDYNTSDKTLTLKTAGDTDAIGNARYVAGSNLKLKNVDFDEALTEYKADDYIVAFVYSTSHKSHDDGGAFKISEIQKLSTLEGTVDSYKVDGEVVLDGTTYKYSTMTAKSTSTATEKVQGTQYTVGQKAIVVLDQTGKYVIAVDEAIVSANYVFVADIATTSDLNSKAIASLFFTDGTHEEGTIKKLLTSTDATTIRGANNTDSLNGAHIGSMGKTQAASPAKNAGWYLYSKDSSGQYTLYSIPGGYQQSAYLYNGGAAADGSTKILTQDRVNFLTADRFGTAHGGSATQLTAFNTQTTTTTREGTTNDLDEPNAIRANNKTIFIISDYSNNNDGDVYVYEGVKNVPDITLTGTAGTPGNDGVAVVSVVAKDGYAKYVYVTVDGTSDVDSQGKALLYIISYDGEFVREDNDHYYKMNVLDGTEEVKANADSDLRGTDDNRQPIGSFYEAYYKVHLNSDEEYTGLDRIRGGVKANGDPADGSATDPYYDGKYFAMYDVAGTDANAKLRATLGEKDGALTLGGTSFTLANDYKIYLVSPKAYTDQDKTANTGSAVMNGDTKADYKVEVVTAKQLVNRLNNYTNVTFDVQGRTVDNWTDSTKALVEAYVTVTAATNAVNTHTVNFSGKNGNAAAADLSNTTALQINNATAPADGVTTVADGRDYTFTLRNRNDTLYTVGTVSYTMNGRNYTLGTGVGTYTISDITGNVEVTVAYTGPSRLSITLNNSTVKAVKINGVTNADARTALNGSSHAVDIADGATVQVVIDANEHFDLTKVTLDAINQTIVDNDQSVVNFTMNGNSAIEVTTADEVATTTVNYTAPDYRGATSAVTAGAFTVTAPVSNTDTIAVAGTGSTPATLAANVTVGATLSFTVDWGANLPDYLKVVKYGNDVITPSGSGVYRITVEDGKTVAIGAPAVTFTATRSGDATTDFVLNWAENASYGAGTDLAYTPASTILVPKDAVINTKLAEKDNTYYRTIAYDGTTKYLDKGAETNTQTFNITASSNITAAFTVNQFARKLSTAWATLHTDVNAIAVTTNANVVATDNVTDGIGAYYVKAADTDVTVTLTVAANKSNVAITSSNISAPTSTHDSVTRVADNDSGSYTLVLNRYPTTVVTTIKATTDPATLTIGAAS